MLCIKKDIATIKKNESEIKKTLIEMKNTVEGIDSRLDETEDWVNYFEQ